jgi:low affinity Fe/Cu permease
MKLRNRVSASVTSVLAFLGTGTAILLAVVLLVAWLVIGIASDFTSHWMDVLHAVAGATTFLMVFLLRHTEGRDMRAVMVKLDELVAAVEGTNEDVIGIEQDELHEQERAEQRAASA